MKIWIANLLVKILVRMDVSCLVGFTLIDGEIKPNKKVTFYYNSNFVDVKVKDYDGSDFELPEGKFDIRG